MSRKVEVNSNSIGFAGLLTIAFIVLKLTDIIDWSWIWVLSPIWLPILIILAVLGVILSITYLSMYFTKGK